MFQVAALAVEEDRPRTLVERSGWPWRRTSGSEQSTSSPGPTPSSRQRQVDRRRARRQRRAHGRTPSGGRHLALEGVDVRPERRDPVAGERLGHQLLLGGPQVGRGEIDARHQSASGAPSKKSTSPVSSEYSAPTTSRPSSWMSCSSRARSRGGGGRRRRGRWRARPAAPGPRRSSRSPAASSVSTAGRIAVDDRARCCGDWRAAGCGPPRAWPGSRRTRCGPGRPPGGVPKRVGGELDAADLRRRDDVAGDADHEQIAQALVEHDLGRDPRVGAAEDDGDRALAPPRAPPRRVWLSIASRLRTPEAKRRLPSRSRDSASCAEIVIPRSSSRPGSVEENLD